MGSFEDDAYWELRHAEPPFCSIHEDEEMGFDRQSGEWWCRECDYDDETTRTYNYG